MCSYSLGTVVTLLEVQKDTLLPLHASGIRLSQTPGFARNPGDSLLADASTLLPAARVKLLELDPGTRGWLASLGITAKQPTAFLLAAPHRSDCLPTRYRDSTFAIPGETGYVRGHLAPKENWINGAPVIVIHDPDNYPYPRRRRLPYVPREPGRPIPSARAMFEVNAALKRPIQFRSAEERSASDSVVRHNALEWARRHPVEAELEPLSSLIREAVLTPDMARAHQIVSRVRGTYRVHMATADAQQTWYFRTGPRAYQPWRGPDHISTAELVASPHVSGYRLVGHAGPTTDSIKDPDRGTRDWDARVVYLGTTDRPTTKGNENRRRLAGHLQFRLDATQPSLWPTLYFFVPYRNQQDSISIANGNVPVRAGGIFVTIPLDVRIGTAGEIVSDTVLTKNGRTLRVRVERIDTIVNR